MGLHLASAIPLSNDAIKALLGKEERKTPPQVGPIKWYDVTMRCASRGCGSPTTYKFRGVPYCMTHTLKLANELMVSLGVDV